MSYIDGFLVPVRRDRKDAYLEAARLAAPIFLDCGALRVVETWGDDLPPGKVTDFTLAVKGEAEETTAFSWVEWPSKAVRDEGMKKFMADPRMAGMGDPPFDGKRMVFGGFETILDHGRG
jgi:uncharacterized protein YbaA (DUF1428 family)